MISYSLINMPIGGFNNFNIIKVQNEFTNSRKILNVSRVSSFTASAALNSYNNGKILEVFNSDIDKSVVVANADSLYQLVNNYPEYFV